MNYSEVRPVVRVVSERYLAILRRYWFNTISGFLITYAMFVILFLGGQSAAPEALGESLTAITVGFFVWVMAFGAFQDPAESLMDEAQWGTLEQLYMTPVTLGIILGVQVLFSLLVSVAIGLLLLLLMMVTTGEYLTLHLLTVIPLSLLTIATAAGVGFALGGLALIYKRIERVFSIVPFLFVGSMAAPSEPVVLNALPLAYGYDLLMRAIENGVRLWEFSPLELGSLIFLAVAYLAVGGIVLRVMTSVARRRGVMGHY